MFDMTGSYDISFFIVGTIVAISGLILFPIPYMKSHQGRHKRCMESIDETHIHGFCLMLIKLYLVHVWYACFSLVYLFKLLYTKIVLCYSCAAAL